MTLKKWVYSCLGCVGVLALCVILLLKIFDYTYEKQRAERRAKRDSIMQEEPTYIPLYEDTPEALIFYYAFWGNTTALDMLFLSGIDVDIRDDEGKTPLHEAAEYNQPQVVKYLLSRGADVNARDDDGLQPIHKAALGKSVESLRLLLDAGADINARTNNLYTPLMLSIYESDIYPLDAMTFLIDKGADVNLQEVEGRTCLIEAVLLGYKQVVLILLNHGADPYIETISGGSSFGAAELSSNKDMVEVLKPYRKENPAAPMSR